MKEKEYNLTIFDLVEGEEYRSDHGSPLIYKITDKQIFFKEKENAPWELSSLRIVIMFKKIIPKKIVTFYRYFYSYGDGTLECSGWVGEQWLLYNRDEKYALINVDSRDFETTRQIKGVVIV